MKISFIIGLVLVLAAGVRGYALLPTSPHPILGSVLFVGISIPVLFWLWK